MMKNRRPAEELMEEMKTKAWAKAKDLRSREEAKMMAKEKQNGIFLWRASLGGRHGGWGSPINEDLLDNRKKMIKEEREMIKNHENDRNKYLKFGLQQMLYVKKCFNLSLAKLIELIVREDDETNNFLDHSRTEITRIPAANWSS